MVTPIIAWPRTFPTDGQEPKTATDVQIRNVREDDLEAIVALINEAEAVEKMERGISLTELWARLHQPGLDPTRDAFLAEADGRLVGFCAYNIDQDEAEWGAETWGVVHPAWRRQGIGRRLLEAVCKRIEEAAPRQVGLATYIIGSARVRDRGRETDQDRVALFRSLGFAPARIFWTMERDLTAPIPEAPLPDGLIFRSFVRGQDEGEFLDAFNEAFADHWGPSAYTAAELEHVLSLPYSPPELFVLAVDGSTIAGFAWCQINSDQNARTGRRDGYVAEVGVRRAYRRRGIGAAVVAEGLRRLRAAGMTKALLGVDANSPTGATRLYERLGFVVIREAVLFTKEIRPQRDGQG